MTVTEFLSLYIVCPYFWDGGLLEGEFFGGGAGAVQWGYCWNVEFM